MINAIFYISGIITGIFLVWLVFRLKRKIIYVPLKESQPENNKEPEIPKRVSDELSDKYVFDVEKQQIVRVNVKEIREDNPYDKV